MWYDVHEGHKDLICIYTVYIENFSESALEAPLEIEKVLNTVLLGFINAMVELNKYLEDISRMCEEAMAHTKLRVTKIQKKSQNFVSWYGMGDEARQMDATSPRS